MYTARQASASIQTNKQKMKALTSVSASERGLACPKKPKTQQQLTSADATADSSLHLQSAGHQAARAGARASKHYSSRIFDFHLFSIKKIYLSLLMMFYREIKIV